MEHNLTNGSGMVDLKIRQFEILSQTALDLIQSKRTRCTHRRAIRDGAEDLKATTIAIIRGRLSTLQQ